MVKHPPQQSVDNFVDKSLFSVDNCVDNLCISSYAQVIHILHTVYPHSYPQGKTL
jgi:hypothetical protein